jgi:hypothetical protein
MRGHRRQKTRGKTSPLTKAEWDLQGSLRTVCVSRGLERSSCSMHWSDNMLVRKETQPPCMVQAQHPQHGNHRSCILLHLQGASEESFLIWGFQAFFIHYYVYMISFISLPFLSMESQTTNCSVRVGASPPNSLTQTVKSSPWLQENLGLVHLGFAWPKVNKLGKVIQGGN